MYFYETSKFRFQKLMSQPEASKGTSYKSKTDKDEDEDGDA